MHRDALQLSYRITEHRPTTSRLRTTATLWMTLGCTALLGCDSSDDDATKKGDVTQAEKTSIGGGGGSKSEAPNAGSKAGSKDSSNDSEKSLSSTIMTPSGPVTGEVAHDDEKQVLIFRGVPYAQPPEGDLRW